MCVVGVRGSVGPGVRAWGTRGGPRRVAVEPAGGAAPGAHLGGRPQPGREGVGVPGGGGGVSPPPGVPSRPGVGGGGRARGVTWTCASGPQAASPALGILFIYYY